LAEAADRLAKSRAALDRIERALTRLDRAILGRKNEQALSEDLVGARAEYERLAKAARSVEERLGGVRERLRAVLGG